MLSSLRRFVPHLLAIAAGVSGLACSGSQTVSPSPNPAIPTQEPTVGLTPSFPTPVLPVASGGPVALYTRGEPGGGELAAYDLQAGRLLWSVPWSDQGIKQAAVGGRTLAIEWSPAKPAGRASVIGVYSFDSRALRELLRSDSENTSFEHLAVSDDGRTLALVLYEAEPPGTPLPIGVPGPPQRLTNYLAFYDIASGRELARVDSIRPEFTGFRGSFGPLAWRNDGAGVFMWGQTNSEAPGDSATVFLDGRIVRHELKGAPYVAPDARHAAEGIGSLGCLFYSGHSVTLRDLDSGRSLASISDDTRAFTGVAWSPDSSEFLLESRPWSPDLQCERDRWWAADPQFYIARIDTGAIEPVASAEAVYRRWYGARLTWLDCEGLAVMPRPHPFGNPVSMTCRREGVSGTLYIHGQAADKGRYFGLIGILE